MSSTAGLHVAIYNDGGVYKHWSLFINGLTDEEQTILHIVGSSTRYRFQKEKFGLPKISESLGAESSVRCVCFQNGCHRRGSRTGTDSQ